MVDMLFGEFDFLYGYFASATIYFDDDEYIAYKRYASYETVAFLSNIGGLLGLFLGVSIFSFVEILYFLTLRLVGNWWRRF
jgi:amiloride-sensitive sodium channel